MKYAIYRLIFPRGYHVSDFRLSDAKIKITADVLFSALVHEANSHGGDSQVEELLQLVNEDQVGFTDLFPYRNETLYLPKPIKTTVVEDKNPEYKKEMKKIEFIPLDQLENYLVKGIDIASVKNGLREMGHFSHQEKIKHSASGDHDIFSFSAYHFTEGAGLYFILAYESDENLLIVNQLLQTLSFSGIGGKRTLGYGRFSYSKENAPEKLIDLLTKENAEYLLLTTSFPQHQECEGFGEDEFFYKLSRRAGFILPKSDAKNRNTQKKREQYFFESGSVFPHPYHGNLFRVDQNFAHPVYRYGKALFLGVNYDEYENI